MVGKSKIDRLMKEFTKKGLIGKNFKTESRTVLTWLFFGKKKAKEVSRLAVQNLIDNGFVDKTGENIIMGDKNKIDGLDFCLVVLGAKGFIKQSHEGGK